MWSIGLPGARPAIPRDGRTPRLVLLSALAFRSAAFVDARLNDASQRTAGGREEAAEGAGAHSTYLE